MFYYLVDIENRGQKWVYDALMYLHNKPELISQTSLFIISRKTSSLKPPLLLNCKRLFATNDLKEAADNLMTITATQIILQHLRCTDKLFIINGGDKRYRGACDELNHLITTQTVLAHHNNGRKPQKYVYSFEGSFEESVKPLRTDTESDWETSLIMLYVS